MSAYIPGKISPRDYSLIGRDAARAVELGLADAKWYASPIPKDKMRELLERKDGPALRDTAIWFGLLFLFGLGGYLLSGTGWAIIPFFLYGVIYGSTSDSRWHESNHGTAFKTDWLNNALYEIASFMVLRESVVWKWSHTRHHSDTIVVGRDPEIAVPRPVKLRSVLLKFVGMPVFFKYFRRVALHCTGKLAADEKTFIPESAWRGLVLRARIYAAIYLAVLALAVATRSILPLLYIGLPNIYGTWLAVLYGLTQHAGLAEDVLDHRKNTRTINMNRLHRYLYWNMGWHTEHHMFPLVPYHALPRLHELVKDDLPKTYDGLIDAYREVIPALRRMARDPDYFVDRPLPPPAPHAGVPYARPAITAENKRVVDGWIEVCSSGLLLREDVIRFDHGNKVYAIYRAADGKVYATDGECTHGNAILADGMVSGNLIECPKHNGRFDIRDGSPQRLPVCVPIATYAVHERASRIYLNLNPPGGATLADAARTHTFRVVSNEHVAAFIKELVLEPDREAGSPPLVYQPGDYMQFEIPAYEERSLAGLSVPETYAPLWRDQAVSDLAACNPIACRRSYSFASNPAADRYLRFNVRLATPSRAAAASDQSPTDRTLSDQSGQSVASPLSRAAGVGSAHIFSLRPGDRISALGPFGAFHILPTQREMVYLGGGAGMAPLRSHLAYLFETEKTTRKVSFWYGARSLKELFYADYFEELARAHPNFTFHVALSEPRPEDAWTSHVGYIHQVLRREYLSTHPNSAQVEYYLCGPLPMVRAAIAMLTDLDVPREQILSDEF